MRNMILSEPFSARERRIPAIGISRETEADGRERSVYKRMIAFNLASILDDTFDSLVEEKERSTFLKKAFPSVTWSFGKDAPSSLSLLCIYKYRMYASKFVHDMITRWLVPGKKLNLALSFSSDFFFETDPEQIYIINNMLIDIELSEDLREIKKTLPLLAHEILLGVGSFDRGMRILETKGLNPDEKVNLIQETVINMITRKPGFFDRDLFSEMQHFFVFSQEDFKVLREYRHMVRIICWQYLFRKSLHGPKEAVPLKRLVRVKLMKTRVSGKSVLGILIGINYLKENESFGQKQIIKSFTACIPQARAVQHSFLSYKSRGEEPLTLYLEAEKINGLPFTGAEMNLLRLKLPEEIKGSIEQLMHPIFMPRNEEEIMKNILNLSRQLRSPGDIPQIVISFDRQGHNHIIFTVILLRIIKNDDFPLQEIFTKSKFKYEFVPDQIKIVGYLKKKYSKQANVFYVRLEKGPFLRKDHSLDLHKARKAILEELYHILGEVRDYNGGMIAKETEAFLHLKRKTESKKYYNELLLENFFYSLTPVIARSMLSPDLLEISFTVFLDLLQDDRVESEGYLIRFFYHPKYVLSYIAARNSGFSNYLQKVLEGLKYSRFQLISTMIHVDGIFYLGFIFHSEWQEERKEFCEVLQRGMELWGGGEEKIVGEDRA